MNPCVVLFTLFFSHLTYCHESPTAPDSSDDQGPVYTHQWAVHIDGDEDIARELAAKHGFTYLGEVGSQGMSWLLIGSCTSN